MTPPHPVLMLKKNICSTPCTELMHKLCLSPFDTKRWILDDGVNTLALGHWRTVWGSHKSYYYMDVDEIWG